MSKPSEVQGSHIGLYDHYIRFRNTPTGNATQASNPIRCPIIRKIGWIVRDTFAMLAYVLTYPVAWCFNCNGLDLFALKEYRKNIKVTKEHEIKRNGFAAFSFVGLSIIALPTISSTNNTPETTRETNTVPSRDKGKEPSRAKENGSPSNALDVSIHDEEGSEGSEKSVIEIPLPQEPTDTPLPTPKTSQSTSETPQETAEETLARLDQEKETARLRQEQEAARLRQEQEAAALAQAEERVHKLEVSCQAEANIMMPRSLSELHQSILDALKNTPENGTSKREALAHDCVVQYLCVNVHNTLKYDPFVGKEIDTLSGHEPGYLKKQIEIQNGILEDNRLMEETSHSFSTT